MSTTEHDETGPDEFADLAQRARAIDGAADTRASEHAASELAAIDAQAGTMVADLVSVLKMARGMAGAAFAWWPQFEAVWNDDVVQGIAENGSILMIRHGWTMGDLMSKWGPYLGLLGAVAPAAYATWLAIQERKAEKGGEHVGHQQTAD